MGVFIIMTNVVSLDNCGQFWYREKKLILGGKQRKICEMLDEQD